MSATSRPALISVEQISLALDIEIDAIPRRIISEEEGWEPLDIRLSNVRVALHSRKVTIWRPRADVMPPDDLWRAVEEVTGSMPRHRLVGAAATVTWTRTDGETGTVDFSLGACRPPERW